MMTSSRDTPADIDEWTLQDDEAAGIGSLEHRVIAILDDDAPDNWLFEWSELAGGQVVRVDLADMDCDGLFVAAGYCPAIDLSPEAVAAVLRMSVYLTRGEVTIQPQDAEG